MTKYISLFTLVFSLTVATYAQDQAWTKAHNSFYEAYLAGDSQGMMSASNTFKQLADAHPTNLPLVAEYVQTRYSIVGFCMEGDCGIDVEDVLDDAIDYAEAKLKKDKSNANLNAVYGGMLGIKIGLSPMQGMFLGPKSAKYVDKAFELDPGNPLAHMFQAFSSYNTPAMFGGSKEKGQQSFLKSATAFEKRGQTTQNWAYLDALAWNGIALQELGKTEEAKASFQKAMDVAPNFGWVRYSLMPKVAAN